MLVNTVNGPVTDPETGKVFDFISYYDDANDPPDPAQISFTAGSARNKVYTGGGNDRFALQALDDWGNGEAGNDYFEGGSGSDTLYGGIGEDELRGGIEKDYLYGGAGNDTLYGSGNSSVTSDRYDGGNYLEGNEGDDTFYGHGNDTLVGGIDNDTYIVDNTTDIITEYFDEGFDDVQSSVTYTLGDNLESLYLIGDAAAYGTGNTLDNSIFGNDANNTLSGGAGNDFLMGGDGVEYLDGGIDNDDLYGFGGNDTLIGGSGNDSLYGREDNDLLQGGTGDDLLMGGSDALTSSTGDDNLEGGSGNDVLLGQDGIDKLVGGTGADELTGGTDNDEFVFDIGTAFKKSTIGIDTITDFTRGADKIVLDKTTFTALSKLSFASVGSLAKAQTSSARITYIQSSGSLFYNQNGASSGFGKGEQFADLTDGLVLTASDFLVQA